MKQSCDELLTLAIKPAPPRYCSSLWVHVNICMANSHTGGCMWPQGLIHDTDWGSLMSVFRPCGAQLSLFGVYPCILAGLCSFSYITVTSLTLWPPTPIPSRVHSTSQHCSSTYHFFVSSYFLFLLFNVKIAQAIYRRYLFSTLTDLNWLSLIFVATGL